MFGQRQFIPSARSSARAALAASLAVGVLAAPLGASTATAAGSQVAHNRPIVPATGLPLGEMPTAPQRARAQAAMRRSGLSSAAAPYHLTYYGGPVISNAQVVTVLWGSPSGANFMPQVAGTAAPSFPTFFNSVGNSAYIRWLREYNTPAGSGTNQAIGFAQAAGTSVLTGVAGSGIVTDATIQSAITSAVAYGTLPQPVADAQGNVNTIYALYFPYGVQIQAADGTSLSGVQFCAYHGSTNGLINGYHVPYMILPDPRYGGMTSGCGTGSALQNLQSYTAHEWIETVTDAQVAQAPGTSAPLAWYDPNNGEIGDICNGVSGVVVGSDAGVYSVQQEWSNALGKCIITAPATAPDAVSSLQVTQTSTTQTHISWAAPQNDGGSPITGYSVYSSTTQGQLGTVVAANLPPATLYYDDSGLTPGTTYYYTVVASNSVGPSPQTTQSVALATPPTAPRSVSAGYLNPAGMVVYWQPPISDGGSPITGYEITTYAGGSTQGTVSGGTIAATETSAPVTGLTPGVTYQFTVTALNAYGSSSESARSAPVIDPYAPSAPTGVTAVASGAGKVTVSWSPPSDTGGLLINGYDVYASSTPGTLGTAIAASPVMSGATTVIDSSQTPGATVFYTVDAVNAVGASVGSTQVMAVVGSVPQAPSSVSAKAAGKTITVSWQAPGSDGGSPITQYIVCMTTGGSTCLQVSTLTAQFTGLSLGQPYAFKAYAVSAWGTSAASSITPALSLMLPPGQIRSAHAAFPGKGKATVTWLAPQTLNGAPAVSYRVRWSANGRTWTSWSTVRVATASRAGLVRGKRFFAQIEALDGAGASSPVTLSFVQKK